MVPSFPSPALRWIALLPWLIGLALVAQAEPGAGSRKPDPLDPQAQVPALRYESPFKPDARSAADKPLSWREANDSVARIGGWRVYAREAQQPEPAPMAKPLPPSAATPALAKPPAMPQGHADHKMP